MSPYEFIQIANEFETTATNMLLGYASILFAFLIACYLAADRLNWVMATVLLALFSVFSFQLGSSTISKVLDLRDIAAAIRKEIDAGNSEFPALFMIQEGAPGDYGSMADTYTVLFIATYIAAVIFFFSSRFSNRK